MSPCRVSLADRTVASRANPLEKLAILLAVCCLSAASAQWNEATTLVPDSFGGLQNPQCLTHNATNNTIYVGGRYSDCVIAIDGVTNQKIARIPTGMDVYDICYNLTTNKVYCANYGSNDVTVIDGAADSVIRPWS